MVKLEGRKNGKTVKPVGPENSNAVKTEHLVGRLK